MKTLSLSNWVIQEKSKYKEKINTRQTWIRNNNKFIKSFEKPHNTFTEDYYEMYVEKKEQVVQWENEIKLYREVIELLETNSWNNRD